VNTKAQTTIYVVSFLACVTIAYLVGNERGHTQGQIAGEATANKAWVTKDAHKDTMHALAVSNARMDGACQSMMAMTESYFPTLRTQDLRAKWLEMAGNCIAFYQKQGK